MPDKLQLIGRQFDRLTVRSVASRPISARPNGRGYWLCDCICGGTIVTRSDYLVNSHVRSCGCDRKRIKRMPERLPEISIEDHFWMAVNKSDGCWEWQASREKQGYGRFPLGTGPSIKAHRYAWQISFGPIPEGLHVLHRCDNPPCVRPDHLFLGTNKDNVDDKMAKCRHVAYAGEKHGNAKFKDEQIRDIRCNYKNGERQTSIARRYGVRQSDISRIVRRESWKTVE